MSFRLTSGCVHFDYLIMVVSARFLHYKDIICPFRIDKYFVRRLFKI